MIGINTAIISPTGGSIGIGFAIPVNTAKRIVPQLISKGYVSYPFVGATVQPLLPEIAKFLKLDIEKGAMVVEVTPGGPADKAGLKGGNRQVQIGNILITVGGDVITHVDQKEVKNAEELIRTVREKSIGDTVTLKTIRDGKPREVRITLQERPKNFRR
jgi:S1-C subfamily serine protease